MNDTPDPEVPSFAFQGNIEILNATWSLDEGRMVEFRLCGDSFGRLHPFKKYQQRRNGRVGTRFMGAFAADGEPVRYQGEVMLASWKDTSGTGLSVRLWLDNEHSEHPFAGCQRRKNGTPGDILFLALVEIQDDETQVDQDQRDRITGAGATGSVESGPWDGPQTAGADTADQRAAQSPQRSDGARNPAAGRSAGGSSKPRKLSSSAHLLLGGALFLRYLQETKATLVKEWTSEKARLYAKNVMKVESLSDLDRDPEAAKRFHQLIRRPYDMWYRQEPP
jgi:hypothetical protein